MYNQKQVEEGHTLTDGHSNWFSDNPKWLISAWVAAEVQICDGHVVQKKMLTTLWTKKPAESIMRTQGAAREQSGAWRPTGTVAPATFNASTPPAPHPPPGDGPGPGEAATLAQRDGWWLVGWLSCEVAQGPMEVLG